LKENNKTIGLMGQTVGTTFKRIIIKSTTCWHAWNYFHRYYSNEGYIEDRGMVTERTFYALKYDKSKGIMELITDIDRHGDELHLEELWN
jgi:hypothetical protein